MIMSHQKNDDSLSKYSSILASLITYLQSIDTWYEYLVFTSVIIGLLLSIDLVSNEGHIIKSVLQQYTTAHNLPYRDSDRDFIASINIKYPSSGIGIVPCSSIPPLSHKILLGLGGHKEMCRVVIINKDAPSEAESQTLSYFNS